MPDPHGLDAAARMIEGAYRGEPLGETTRDPEGSRVYPGPLDTAEARAVYDAFMELILYIRPQHRSIYLAFESIVLVLAHSLNPTAFELLRPLVEERALRKIEDVNTDIELMLSIAQFFQVLTQTVDHHQKKTEGETPPPGEPA